jgi:hypothetical protein
MRQEEDERLGGEGEDDRVKVPDLSMRRLLSIMVEVDVDDPTTNV